MHDFANPLRSLMYPRACRTRRVSTWNTDGNNTDFWTLGDDETRTLAEIPGAGIITHIWMTTHAKAGAQAWPRGALLRMSWDGQDRPSVEVPLGDFFGVGHGMVRRWQSLPLNMTANYDPRGGEPGTTAFNSWWPMPFSDGAKIELVNEGGIGHIYFYIDYEEHDALPEGADLRFHAHWRRECPCDGWRDPYTPNHGPVVDSTPNLDGRGNYVVLETEGRGHFVGCNLSIDNQRGSWWGEGDDMVWVDDDFDEDGSTKWPPTLHGTGTEDYFNHAYGMQDIPDGLYHGVSLFEPQDPLKDPWKGRFTCYRFHIADPIVFQRRIKFTIEHGHANARSDDWSSTAYWYQTLPTPPLPPVPPYRERLPIEP
jgi:hypothetical protein